MIIVTNDKMTRHDTGAGHPECPDRLDVITKAIETDLPDAIIETAYPANEERVLLAHPQHHLDSILDHLPFDGYASIDGGDTVLCPESYDMALLAVGASCQAVDAVLEGRTKTAFALARPPGHHAEYDTAMGFCLFNNAFIAARHAQKRVVIIDFDVHHGNGTEDLVKRRVAQGDLDIAYASTHQSPLFPGTGQDDSQNICNVPLSAGTDSQNFQAVFQDRIIPFVKKFAPELVIFSAGFDAHKRDPIGGMAFEHDDFAFVVDAVKPICSSIVSVLEGGYNLDDLGESVVAHLKALAL